MRVCRCVICHGMVCFMGVNGLFDGVFRGVFRGVFHGGK